MTVVDAHLVNDQLELTSSKFRWLNIIEFLNCFLKDQLRTMMRVRRLQVQTPFLEGLCGCEQFKYEVICLLASSFLIDVWSLF